MGLGALSGHLMHSLKTPLTHLQMIVREAKEKKAIDGKELQAIHGNMRDLVSQSLQTLREFETKKFLTKLRSLNSLIRLLKEHTNSSRKHIFQFQRQTL